MKREIDKLEEFRLALNVEAKSACGVENAFSREEAEATLQRLIKSWRMDKDRVIATMVHMAQGTLDKQFRSYVLRFLELEKIPYSEQEIKQRWETLTSKEKNEVLDGIINHMDKYRRQN